MGIHQSVYDEIQFVPRARSDVRVTREPLHLVAPPSAGAAWGQAMASSAVSMLQPPAARSGVGRPGLVDRLAESLEAKLVLVVAPAGWGKTCLLRDWWLATDRSRRAWLSIETAHDHPARFWSAVIAAIDTACPGTGEAALQALAAAGAQPPGYVERLLIDELARMPGRVTLVLDDFHLITNADVLASFGWLVQHLPPTFGLVVAARSEPALPLARLRACGEMAEIRAGELRFSEAEAAQLLGETLGLVLPPEQVHALWQRTEGWAAGLYLAGLALRGSKDGDPAGFVHSFAGDDRHIADYLAAEVLAGLPPQIRSFLLRTCVLDRFSGPLCDAVTGSPGSQSLLEEIERAEVFVVPLDNARRWYRYHALFAEVLRGELDRAEPGLAPLLHRRASAWHRHHGTITEAIAHATAAGDLPDARELIAEHWHNAQWPVPGGTLQSWLERLPRGMVAADARMCLIRGVAAWHAGQPRDAEPWLAVAEAAGPAGPFPHGPACIESGVGILRAAGCYTAGDLAGAEAAARRAAELELDGGGADWWAPAIAMLGAVLSWRGRDAEASDLLELVTGPCSQPTDTPVGRLARLLALGCTAAIAARRGDSDTAWRRAREAADFAARHNLAGHWAGVTAELAAASVLAEDGEQAAAEAAALDALGHAQRHQARLETAAALLSVADIDYRAGRTTDAHGRTSDARNLIAQLPDPGIVADLLADAERRASLQPPMPASPRRNRRPDGLTAREAEVLSLLTKGCTNLEIAAELVVSVHTVERHLQNSYRKVGVRNRADAAAYMTRTGS